MTENNKTDLPAAPQPVERQAGVRSPNDSLPGQRAALRPGTQRGVPPEPQGDENREPGMAPTPPP